MIEYVLTGNGNTFENPSKYLRSAAAEIKQQYEASRSESTDHPLSNDWVVSQCKKRVGIFQTSRHEGALRANRAEYKEHSDEVVYGDLAEKYFKSVGMDTSKMANPVAEYQETLKTSAGFSEDHKRQAWDALAFQKDRRLSGQSKSPGGHAVSRAANLAKRIRKVAEKSTAGTDGTRLRENERLFVFCHSASGSYDHSSVVQVSKMDSLEDKCHLFLTAQQSARMWHRRGSDPEETIRTASPHKRHMQVYGIEDEEEYKALWVESKKEKSMLYRTAMVSYVAAACGRSDLTSKALEVSWRMNRRRTRKQEEAINEGVHLAAMSWCLSICVYVHRCSPGVDRTGVCFKGQAHTCSEVVLGRECGLCRDDHGSVRALYTNLEST